MTGFQPNSGFDGLVKIYTDQVPHATITVGGGQKLTQAMIDAAKQGALTDRPVIRVNCAGNGFDIAQGETISGVATSSTERLTASRKSDVRRQRSL